MIDSKISTIIETQLPEFIKNDPTTYSNFITFIKAYYEWLEQPDNVLYKSKKLLDYKDIDNTTDEFINYYLNEFFQYFDLQLSGIVDKNRILRVAKDLYSSKGTPSSFKFLFKILYNIDCDTILTKDYVLKPSSGTWFVPKNLTVKSSNLNFLSINNLRVFGNQSKSFALVENCVQNGDYFEIYISNITRKFKSGETIIVVDNFNNPVLFNGEQLSAKLIGQVDSITIDPNNAGTNYLAGYPVSIYGGVPVSSVSAKAVIDSTTLGGLLNVDVINGGYGYSIENTKISVKNSNNAVVIPYSVVSTLPPSINIINPGSNYSINDSLYINNYFFADVTSVDSNGGILSVNYRKNIDYTKIYGISASVLSFNSQASGANILISNINRKANAISSFLVKDSLNVFFATNANTAIANTYYNFKKAPFANWYTKLSDAFTFDQIQTYSLDSVLIANPGINTDPIKNPSAISARTVYSTDDIANFSVSDIKYYGTLAPISILNSGIGYNIGDRIIFNGGSGIGANAIVTSVDVNGGILSVDYTYYTITSTQQKRNLLLYSEDFSNTSWVASNSTLQFNVSSTASPFNVFNATKILSNNVKTKHYVRQNVQISSNVLCSISLFAKAAEYNYMALSFYTTVSTYGVYNIINLSDGSISSNGIINNTYHPAFIKNYTSENAGNGWWRIKLSVQLSALGTNTYFEIAPSSNATNYSSYSGSNTSGIYIYGAQLEQSPIITEYQKITNASSNDFIYTTNNTYPLGGINYTEISLPVLSVQSSNANATGAYLTVPGILGSGAQFNSKNDSYGVIKSISVLNGGEDYNSTPSISLRIQDVLVTGVDLEHTPNKLDIFKQIDTGNNIVYQAIFDSFYQVQDNPAYYGIRLFNYNGEFDPTLVLTNITNGINNYNVVTGGYAANTVLGTPDFDIYGLKTYGDGTAKATSTFIDGLNIGKGQYIDRKGQLSSFNVLQSEEYNDYTYKVFVEKELIKYKDVLMNLLHPSGTKMLSSFILKSNTNFYTSKSNNTFKEYSIVSLNSYTGPNTTISLSVDFLGTSNTKSSNILKFNNLSVDLSSFFNQPDTILEINTASGLQYKTQITLFDSVHNIAYLKENVWLTFCNVCSISTTNNSNVIYINNITDSYNTIKSGFYSSNPLSNLIYPGDAVYIANNGANSINSVLNIDYSNNIIYLSNTLIQNSSSSLLTVNRNIIGLSNVNILSSDIYPTIPDLFIPFNNSTNPSLGSSTYIKSGSNNSTYFGSGGTLMTNSTNTPRFGYDPNTGKYLGYLSEDSTTNLLANSEIFGNSILDQSNGNGWVTMVGN